MIRFRPTAEITLPLWRHWIRSRCAPWFTYRFCIISRYAPGWLPWECRQDGWRGMDDAGWLPYPRTAVDAEEYQRGLGFARRQYALALRQFEISTKPDQALRELLELCRREQIAVLLVLMPEGSDFQSWYPPQARAKVDTYLAELSRQYEVPLIDARCWMNDSVSIPPINSAFLSRPAQAFARLCSKLLEIDLSISLITACNSRLR